MRLGLYSPGRSPIHVLPAGAKLLALAAAGLAIFLVDDPTALAGCLATTICLFPLARLPFAATARQALPIAALLAFFLGVHALFTDFATGLVIVLRFATLMLLGLLVTMTTRVSAMTAALEHGLRPLARFGVDPAKAGFVFAVAIRFLPVLWENAREIRAAQKARGLDGSALALLIPLMVRTLRRAEEISEAIDARGVEG